MNIPNIIRFLSGVKENNNREWFAENKSWYETAKSEFEEISKALILEISKFDEEIRHVDAKDCVFRIYRDTRFAHDKTPYKTHFGVFIAAAGGRKSKRGGYYLHIDPAGCFVAVGVWCPPPDLLKALRKSVYENIDELNEIRQLAGFSKYFPHFYDQEKLKTVPPGFPKDFQYAELLKLKHLMVEYQIEEMMLDQPDFVVQIAAILQCAHPLNKFLNFTVDEVYTLKK
ncbi:MAG: DUF2461 domain-containing protein [Paludibacter sp.]|nr:DUF2461 domain-containing protein [Paludibacter sp.]